MYQYLKRAEAETILLEIKVKVKIPFSFSIAFPRLSKPISSMTVSKKEEEERRKKSVLTMASYTCEHNLFPEMSRLHCTDCKFGISQGRQNAVGRSDCIFLRFLAYSCIFKRIQRILAYFCIFLHILAYSCVFLRLRCSNILHH